MPQVAWERASYATVVRSRSKILQFRTKTRPVKEGNWCGPSSLYRSLSAESDLQYSLNPAETCYFKAAAFCLNHGVIKNRIRYFPLCQKECFNSSLQRFSFFLRRSVYLPRIRLDMKSTDFFVGETVKHNKRGSLRKKPFLLAGGETDVFAG